MYDKGLGRDEPPTLIRLKQVVHFTYTAEWILPNNEDSVNNKR